MPNDAKPLLSVRNLKTSFFQDEGTTKAVDGASLRRLPGKTLGIVGESGCGKSVTARSILRIVDRPGRIVDGEIFLHPRRRRGRVDLVKLNANGREIRAIRGGDIALIFQEPMTSFSPVHTVGSQIVEAIRAPQCDQQEGGEATGDRDAAQRRHPEAGAAHRRVLRSSSPAACASAR